MIRNLKVNKFNITNLKPTLSGVCLCCSSSPNPFSIPDRQGTFQSDRQLRFTFVDVVVLRKPLMF